MNPMDIRQAVDGIFRTLMSDRGTPIAEVDPDRGLYADGYGLDSMDTATLSAMLSDHFDDDPYMLGVFPKNVSEIVTFYDNRPTRS